MSIVVASTEAHRADEGSSVRWHHGYFRRYPLLPLPHVWDPVWPNRPTPWTGETPPWGRPAQVSDSKASGIYVLIIV